ncbi:ABC transporter substrate-binding protein [Celeribacter sp.]|uniref:ABC transporter substrate-binding protein n=1 Tax=Celeribacter sp. TaxID=1890673 RepID=UPI003A941EBA
MKLNTLILSSAASLALLAGGATAEDLTVWTLSYSSEKQSLAFKLAEEAFEARNPDDNVEVIHRGTDEHKTALRVAAGSDTGPDVYTMWAGLGLGGEYVNAGLSLDLTKYYEKYGWADRVSVPSQAFVEAYADGKHGAPYRFSGEAVYYDQTIFDEVGIDKEPETYEELKAAAVKLKENGYAAFTFGGAVNWHVMRLMDVLLETTCGAEKHDALTSMELDWATEPCAEAAFAEMKWWADDYILAPFMGIDEKQASTLWYAKRAAMMLEGDWMVNAIDENADVSEYGIFPFPTGTNRLYGFAEYLYVSSKSKNPDLAAEFVDMFISTPFQSKINGSFGALSVNKDVKLGDDAMDLHKEWIEIFDAAGGTFVNGDQAFPLAVTTEYFRIINEVASGEMEPKPAAEAMATFIGNL